MTGPGLGAPPFAGSAEARSTGTPLGPEFCAGRGAWLMTPSGERWFDATAGSGAVALGHQHPAVVAAAVDQVGTLVHTGCKLSSTPRSRLTRLLADAAPWPDASVLLATSGAEAVEAALKVARAVTGRRAVVAFERAYHGKTAGALAATWRPELREFSALAEDAVRRVGPPPSVVGDATPGHQPADGMPDARASERFLADLAAALDPPAPAAPPAAVVLEPVQVTEGVHAVAPAVLARVAAMTRAAGALLVLDEIYTGVGRCGSFLYADVLPEPPDLVVVGKTLGNGFPVSAVLGPAGHMDALPAGLHTSTYSGSPVAAAAASAVLGVVEAADLPARARALGTELHALLAGLAGAHPWIRDVRVVGGLAAFDCTRGGVPDPGRALAFRDAALARRMLLFVGGATGSTVKIVPPVLLDAEERDHLGITLAASAVAVEAAAS